MAQRSEHLVGFQEPRVRVPLLSVLTIGSQIPSAYPPMCRVQHGTKKNKTIEDLPTRISIIYK